MCKLYAILKRLVEGNFKAFCYANTAISSSRDFEEIGDVGAQATLERLAILMGFAEARDLQKRAL